MNILYKWERLKISPRVIPADTVLFLWDKNRDGYGLLQTAENLKYTT